MQPGVAEITYGPERLCLMLNKQIVLVRPDVERDAQLSSRRITSLMQHNLYNFEVTSTELLVQLFDLYEAESKRVIETECNWDPELGILSTTVPAPPLTMQLREGSGWFTRRLTSR